ncbi:MAG: DUF4139 domain-containing protein [Sedimentisphaerales bacterium]|nr:DUF4139 domain-containing protein [Sedimentisphaerales bacterium]
MARHVLIVISVLLTLGVAADGAVGAPAAASGTVRRVTVYHGQALVTRAIEVELSEDTTELVVGDLPPNIIPESIYAQTSDGVQVLSVRYRQQAVRDDTREEVRQLDAQMDALRHDLKYATEQLEHAQAQWKMFEGLKDFTVSAEHSDLDRGLLTYEPIGNLTKLIEQKGLEYLERRLELEDKIAGLNKDLELLERKRQELMAGQSRTEREALIFLSGGRGKTISLELSYLVTGANWQQQYNLRADPDRSTVAIEYNAVVNQTSGEDWNGVALSLSTAEPTMVAAAPILEPMLVGLSGRMVAQQFQQQIAQPQQMPGMPPTAQVRELQMSRRENVKKGIAANSELNELATQNQFLFFNADRREAQEFQRQMAEIARIEGVSVTYELPGRLTLPSRSDQQLLSIATIAAKGQFTLIASPLLTDYVYLQAEILNGSDTVLLPGPASIFRDGQFVGKGEVPLVTIGDKFIAGFGIDSQVQVTRELEDKTTRIQGGNRIDTYNYRVALRNYKSASVGLRLLDRLPYTDDSSIRIELDKVAPALSTDAEYLRSLRKKGVLRWDLTLEPNTIDDKATVVTYRYTMEYDRNMQIVPRRSSEQQQ